MPKAVNSMPRSSDTAPARCGLVALNGWWRGNWWRLTPPAVPVAFDGGEVS